MIVIFSCMLGLTDGEYYHTRLCGALVIIRQLSVYKLVILIEPQDHSADFDQRWPEFLARAERMPGLRREVTSHVDKVLHGKLGAHMLHELHFDSLKAAGDAMASPEGQAAGQLLQEISGGKVTLMLTDHAQDDLARFQRANADQSAPPGDRA